VPRPGWESWARPFGDTAAVFFRTSWSSQVHQAAPQRTSTKSRFRLRGPEQDDNPPHRGREIALQGGEPVDPVVASVEPVEEVTAEGETWSSPSAAAPAVRGTDGWHHCAVSGLAVPARMWSTIPSDQPRARSSCVFVFGRSPGSRRVRSSGRLIDAMPWSGRCRQAEPGLPVAVAVAFGGDQGQSFARPTRA
jgi:hypothetical protein